MNRLLRIWFARFEHSDSDFRSCATRIYDVILDGVRSVLVCNCSTKLEARFRLLLRDSTKACSFAVYTGLRFAHDCSRRYVFNQRLCLQTRFVDIIPGIRLWHLRRLA